MVTVCPCVSFEAEKHAGVSCVTVSMDDIQFEEAARYRPADNSQTFSFWRFLFGRDKPRRYRMGDSRPVNSQSQD